MLRCRDPHETPLLVGSVTQGRKLTRRVIAACPGKPHGLARPGRRGPIITRAAAGVTVAATTRAMGVTITESGSGSQPRAKHGETPGISPRSTAACVDEALMEAAGEPDMRPALMRPQLSVERSVGCRNDAGLILPFELGPRSGEIRDLSGFHAVKATKGIARRVSSLTQGRKLPCSRRRVGLHKERKRGAKRGQYSSFKAPFECFLIGEKLAQGLVFRRLGRCSRGAR